MKKPSLGPEPSASTNSAIRAMQLDYAVHLSLCQEKLRALKASFRCNKVCALKGEEGMGMTEALIFKRHLVHNIKTIRSILSEKTKLCAVLKANGYGNGAVTAAQAARECGVEHFAVARVEEGVALREAGIGGEILLLGAFMKEESETLLENSLTPTVFEKETVDVLSHYAAKKGRKIGIYVSIDTGMTRLGAYPSKAGELESYIATKKELSVSGVLTHFAAADSENEEDKNFTLSQFTLFTEAASHFSSVKTEGKKPLITAGASSALFNYPRTHLDMVRIGLSLYGYFPDSAEESLKRRGISLELKPVMQFQTRITLIREVKKGDSVSYARTWRAKKDTKIAVIAAGYADGLPRTYDGCVTIRGKAYPVVGRVCMDMCMVDIGRDNNEVEKWDKAVIFGSKEKGSLFDAAYTAKHSNLSVYEIMCGVSARVPRVEVS